MKHAILLVSALAVSLSAGAQMTQMDLSQGLYKGKIGLQHIKQISDSELQKAATRYSATPMPSKERVGNLCSKARKKMAHARLQSPITQKTSAAQYTEADTLLWENWHGWDGEQFNFVPSTWKRFTNFNETEYIDEATGSCPTWLSLKPDGYYVPYATDGKYVMACLYGEDTEQRPAPVQDEWLVGPTVSNIKSTNYLSFDLAFTPVYTYLQGSEEEMEIDLSKPVYDVEVLVTTDTRTASNVESKYTSLFKLTDVVSQMFREIDPEQDSEITTLLTMRWQHFKLPLTDFEGKSIRVAFRYKGQKGGAIMLDAVRVSDLLPVALFDRPNGSFYMGFSDEAYLNYQKNVVMPAYVNNLWTNYSNDDVEQYTWLYNVNGESRNSKSYHLLMEPQNPGSMDWPTLQTTSGARSDAYKGGADVNTPAGIVHSNNGTVKVGGDANLAHSDGKTMRFSLGNFDPTKRFWMGEISNASKAYAFGTGSDAFWSSFTKAKYNKVSGIANVYDKPSSPYVFNQVMLPLGNYFNVGAKLVCTVYKCNELEGETMEVTDEVLGQAMTSEAKAVSGGHILSFDFPNLMIIDTPIAIAITGIDNSDVIDFAPLSQALNHDSRKGYAFVILKNQTTKDDWWCEVAGALSAVEGAGNMEISHCIGMNAIFPYLRSNDGNLFEASTEGASMDFDINSYWYPEKKGDSDIYNGWTIVCSEPWVSATYAVDDASGKAKLSIQAEALPAGVTGRVATVTIQATGCEEVITVEQGNTVAVHAVELPGGMQEDVLFHLSGVRSSRQAATKGIYVVKRQGKYMKVVK